MASPIPVDSLIQGGAVGISLALVILLYLRGKAHDAIVQKQMEAHDLMLGNHMSRTDKLVADNTKAMSKMASAIDKSAKVSERIERILDRR